MQLEILLIDVNDVYGAKYRSHSPKHHRLSFSSSQVSRSSAGHG